MSTLSLRIPDSLHTQIKKLAKDDGISINQFIATAAAEKISALMTSSYLQKRAKLGSKQKFLSALSKVSDQEPEDIDKL